MSQKFGFSGLKIKDFRGIAYGEINGFSKINVLLGKFGAGKSTILESIYLPIISVGGQNELYTIFIRRTNREGHYGEALYTYDLNRIAKITYVINTDTVEFLLGNKERIDPGFGYGNVVVQVRQNKSHIGTLGYNTNFGYVGGGVSGYDNKTLTLLKGLRLIDNRYKNTVQSVETQFLNPIRQRNLDQKFIELVTEVFDTVKDFEFLEYAPTTNQFRAALKFEDSKVFVDDISDGLRDGLIILATAFMMKDTALLLEEPENHLYPKAMAKLIEKLVQLSNVNNLQLFVATHRPEVVANFVKFGTSDTKVFYVEKVGGDVTAKPSEWNDIKILLDLGLDAGLLAKGFEKYVVVDGSMDKAILESSIRKEKSDRAEDLWVTIIGAGGDTKRKEMVKALIPTGKAVIVFKDMDEHSKEDTVRSVIDSISVLGNEGYDFQEVDDRIEIQKGEIKYTIPKRNIYPIGIKNLTYNGEALNLSKYAIDDYILEMVIQNHDSIGITGENIERAISHATTSKEILEQIMKYKTDEVKNIIENNPLGPSLKNLLNNILS